jgi:hypothetical protein
MDYHLIKADFVGSGKITRRVKIKLLSTLPKSTNNDKRKALTGNPIFPRVTTKRTKRRINFLSPEQRKIYTHWNTFGFPFIIHKNEMTKVNAEALSAITRTLKKYGLNEIIQSMDNCHKLFSSPWFKYRILFQKKKLGLNNFFNFSQRDWKNITRRHTNVPISWFKECRKNIKFLEQEFSVVNQDKHPKVTTILIDIWSKYSRTEISRLSISKINQLKQVSIILVDLCELNKFDPLMALDIIDKMLNDWKTYKPKHPGYLMTDIFWANEFPKELERSKLISIESASGWVID